jgi:hypothetical protein
MFKQLYLVIIQNYTHVHMNLFITMSDTITSQNIDLLPWTFCVVSNGSLQGEP